MKLWLILDRSRADKNDGGLETERFRDTVRGPEGTGAITDERGYR